MKARRAANLANIANGDQAGTMAFGYYEIMFGAVDAIARKVRGADVSARVRATELDPDEGQPALHDWCVPARPRHRRPLQAAVGQVLTGLP